MPLWGATATGSVLIRRSGCRLAEFQQDLLTSTQKTCKRDICTCISELEQQGQSLELHTNIFACQQGRGDWYIWAWKRRGLLSGDTAVWLGHDFIAVKALLFRLSIGNIKQVSLRNQRGCWGVWEVICCTFMEFWFQMCVRTFPVVPLRSDFWSFIDQETTSVWIG